MALTSDYATDMCDEDTFHEWERDEEQPDGMDGWVLYHCINCDSERFMA